jgi:hypothetical protein
MWCSPSRLLSSPKPCSCRMAIPKDQHSFDDIRDKGLTLVTTAGSDTVTTAKDAGIPEDRVMQVAGQAEFLQAVKVGRAAAGSLNYFTVRSSLTRSTALKWQIRSPRRLGRPATQVSPSCPISRRSMPSTRY